MKALTHLSFAFFLSSVIPVPDTARTFFIIVSCVSSLIPDIDTERSFLGKKVWLFSRSLRSLFGHRKLFHSLLFAVSLSVIFSLFNIILGTAVFAGMMSHIFLDSLTRQGTYPLYPVKKKVSFLLKTGGMTESALSMLFIISGVFVLLFSHALHT